MKHHQKHFQLNIMAEEAAIQTYQFALIDLSLIGILNKVSAPCQTESHETLPLKEKLTGKSHLKLDSQKLFIKFLNKSLKLYPFKSHKGWGCVC